MARDKKGLEEEILHGNIAKSILQFFFPILLGSFLQMLYNTVDMAVVGQFASPTALSSVGGPSANIVNLVVGFFGGLGGGCTVKISQYLGAGDKESLDKALHTTIAFATLGGIVSGVLGMLVAPKILVLMRTPEEIIPQSTLYIRIYFAGLVFVFLYNLGASILRALGDSLRPLYYLMTCTGINIVLDLLFVVIFKLDVAGVAIATLIAQGISAVFVLECLMHKKEQVKLELRKIRFHGKILKDMLRIGLPSGIQSSTYGISNLFIVSGINMLGVTTISAWAATLKTDSIFWMINDCFGIACTTFVGINYGARNMKRVKDGTRTCFIMALITALCTVTFLMTCGKYVLRIFSPYDEVVQLGIHMVHYLVPWYFLFVPITIFSAALKAKGDTAIPTFINIMGNVVIRVAFVMIVRDLRQLDLVMFSYPLSWVLCGTAMSIYYFYRRKKDEKQFVEARADI